MQNLDIKNMYEWPLGVRWLVFGLIFFLVLYMGYLLDISPYQNEIKNARQQEDDLKHQLQLMYQNQKKVTQDVQLLPKAKDTLADWQKHLLTKDELPGMLDAILKLGADNQLKITTFDPSSEIKDGIYYKTPVSINMSGTYDQIAVFVSQLANMPKLVNIDAFTLTNNSQNDSSGDYESSSLNSDAILSGTLDIEIYRR